MRWEWHHVTAEAAHRLKVPESHLAFRLKDGAVLLYDRPNTDPDRVLLRVLPPLREPWTKEMLAGLPITEAEA